MKFFNATPASSHAGSGSGKYLHVALALAALTVAGTAPAFAITHHHHAKSSSRPLHMYAGEAFSPAGDVAEGAQIDVKRAAAVHECSVAAAKFSNSAWQTAQYAAYGTCMTDHGQMP